MMDVLPIIVLIFYSIVMVLLVVFTIKASRRQRKATEQIVESCELLAEATTEFVENMERIAQKWREISEDNDA